MDENNSNIEDKEEYEKNEQLAENIEKNVENVENITNKEVTNVKNIKNVKYVEKERKNKSRRKDSNVVVQYRKPSIFTSFLLILIGFLLAVIVLSLVYVFVLKDDKTEMPNDEQIEENNDEQDKSEEAELDLSIEGEFVKELYAKIPFQGRGYEPYCGGIIKFDDISDNNRLLYVLRKLGNEYNYKLINGAAGLESKLTKIQWMDINTIQIEKFDFDVVEKEYKSIFGSSKNVPLIIAETGLGYLYDYCAEDNCFYGHPYNGGGGGEFRPYKVIDSCEANENKTEIYIYDKFMALDFGELSSFGPYKCSLYKTANTQTFGDKSKIEEIVSNLEKTYDDNSSEALYNGMTFDGLIEKYKDSASKFKHTYKLDEDGNYYWYSSERVE